VSARPAVGVIAAPVRSAVEEVGQRLRPVLGVEAVVLVDGYPLQRLPLASELVTPASERLLLFQKRGPAGQPLFARPDLCSVTQPPSTVFTTS
jgi:hypothetical protein